MMKVRDFWRKVEDRRKELGITQETMCREAGLSLQSTRNRIYKERFPFVEETIRLLNVLGYTVEEFFGYPIELPHKEKEMMIPVMDQSFSAGHGQFMPDTEEISEYVAVPKELKKYGENLAACHVNGDSMEPTLYDGDTIICDRNGYDSDGIYIIRYQGSGFVKRIQIVNKTVNIISDNNLYPPMQESISSDDFAIVGKVRYVLHRI